MKRSKVFCEEYTHTTHTYIHTHKESKLECDLFKMSVRAKKPMDTRRSVPALTGTKSWRDSCRDRGSDLELRRGCNKAVSTHTHTHTHIHTYTYTHIHTYINIHTYRHTYRHTTDREWARLERRDYNTAVGVAVHVHTHTHTHTQHTIRHNTTQHNATREKNTHQHSETQLACQL